VTLLDRAGHRLSGSAEAVAAYNRGVDRLLQLRAGALTELSMAITFDPTFAVAHAALALLGQEFCAPVDIRARLASARLHSRRSTDRERSHVDAVVRHVGGDRTAIVSHLGRYPDDALLLSVAVPTIAFAGVTEVPADAWRIVESCAPVYGDDWFFSGLLGFVRQEQGRFDEAMALSCASLEAMPSAGHSAHARAHVHYETGDHAAGLAWIDRWITDAGAHTDNLAHYAWHAALHELADGDLAAVGRRYDAQLSPVHVRGCRSLVDTGSLIWRWGITPGATAVPAIAAAIDVPRFQLLRPPTVFMALHAAVALCADDDSTGLYSLALWAGNHEHPCYRSVIAPLAEALRLLVDGCPSACADVLQRIASEVWRVGGSDAQREVVEETLLTALLRADRFEEAGRLIDTRLDRRPCRRDEWFRELAQETG
jgi:hypothetical protein